MFMNLEQLYKVSVSCTSICIIVLGNMGLEILQKIFSFYFIIFSFELV